MIVWKLNYFLILSRYTLSDGQTRTESAYYKDVGDTKILVVSGSYSFTGTDGKPYYVSYESDENGYRATVNGNFIYIIDYDSYTNKSLLDGTKPVGTPEVAYIDANLLKSLAGWTCKT